MASRERDIMSYYIGIDLGTSAMKLLLTDEGGNIISTACRDYPLLFPFDGWSEQEPYHWKNAMFEGVKELTENVDKSLIKGIGFGGQMHGLVILDDKDEVIRPAILWNDNRTIKECDYLNNVIGKEELSSMTANICFTGFTAPKLLWLYNNEPDNFKRISKIMLPKDYLSYILTGIHSSDYSDASGMLLLDVKNRCWSEKMLDICHVSHEQLPFLYESYEKVGVVRKEVADALGLPYDVTVCAGAGDNAAAAVGTGTVNEGDCTISLGTSGTIFISCDTFGVDENNALHSFAHANGGYHLMGCMLSAASCNRWFAEDILGIKDYEGEQKKIGAPGENHVYFLPYLCGERSPINDPYAKGAFVGMTMDTTRSQMYQAVLEGVAYALKDSLLVAERIGKHVTKAKLCGGGAKSPLWRTILANVLNITLEIPKTEEGPSYGAAILAMVACGEYADVKTACSKLTSVREVVEPDEELAGKYAKGYKTFVRIYPALKDVYTYI